MFIKFSVDTTPYPQPRPCVVRGHAYEPKRITEYKEAVRTIARIHMQQRPPLTGLVFVSVTIRRNIKLGAKNYGDIDNHVKSVLDALSGVCYVDDALVVRLVVIKEQSASEGVDVIVTDEEEGFDVR